MTASARPVILDGPRVGTKLEALDIDPRNIITFPGGLPGFEQCHRFVLLASEFPPLQCLHAMDGPAPSFLVIEPRVIVPDYRASLGRADRERLGATPRAQLLCLAIVTADSAEGAHANLRAPVVVNPETMTGVQLLPSASPYLLRHPLVLPEG